MNSDDVQTDLKFLTDAMNEARVLPDDYFYYGAPKHKEIMARAARVQPEDFRTRSYLILYLQYYVTESAKKANLVATDRVFRTNLNGTIPTEFIFTLPCVKEEYFEPEIEMIRTLKKSFEYSPEFKVAINRAGELFYDRITANGWFQHIEYQWPDMNEQARLQTLRMVSDYYDEALAAAGVPPSKTSLNVSDNPNYSAAWVGNTVFTADPSPIPVNIRDTYLKEMDWIQGTTMIMHEKIHATTSAMAQAFWTACQPANAGAEKPAFADDAALAYFIKEYSLSSRISLIKSIYTSDPEEMICFGQEGIIGVNLFVHVQLGNPFRQLKACPKTADAAPAIPLAPQ